LIRYLDASLIVALLTPEVASERADAWFAVQPAGSLAISAWVATEVSSALSIKLRTGALDLDRRAAALSAWNAIQADSLLSLAITDDHFEAAAAIANQHELGVRAGDALHLAIAAASGHTLATLDRPMAAAASQLGIPVEPL
jgi:predicted nucleic acid-binding protein